MPLRTDKLTGFISLSLQYLFQDYTHKRGKANAYGNTQEQPYIIGREVNCYGGGGAANVGAKEFLAPPLL